MSFLRESIMMLRKSIDVLGSSMHPGRMIEFNLLQITITDGKRSIIVRDSHPYDQRKYRTVYCKPKEDIFGLDKSKAHCFTLPKKMTLPIIDLFNLSSENLQTEIKLEIEGSDVDAIVRRARMNRKKPYKLRPDDLPKREVVQFDWRFSKETISAVKDLLPKAYTDVSRGSRNTSQDALFTYKGNSSFKVECIDLQ